MIPHLDENRSFNRWTSDPQVTDTTSSIAHPWMILRVHRMEFRLCIILQLHCTQTCDAGRKSGVKRKRKGKGNEKR